MRLRRAQRERGRTSTSGTSGVSAEAKVVARDRDRGPADLGRLRHVVCPAVGRLARWPSGSGRIHVPGGMAAGHISAP
jgi:hypothetical protein